MMVKALIVEQLEEDGTLRSLAMRPASHRDLIVAFDDEYDDKRSGPFHFHDDRDARRYRDGFARCRARKLGDRYFLRTGSTYHVETRWSGIPTERNWLSYYALSLPEFGVPQGLSVADPHAKREYRRTVTRDDQRNRYVVYLQCTSSFGQFDFELSCDFVLDQDGFSSSDYQDAKTQTPGSLGNNWRHWLPEDEGNKVQQFFFHVGDTYSANEAGAIGPNAQASNITFHRIWNHNAARLDLDDLQRDLSLLLETLRREPSGSEHAVTIRAVAAAEAAARNGDGPTALEKLKKAGPWAWDVATKIGVNVASEAIKVVSGS